jgi:hypothetical protein
MKLSMTGSLADRFQKRFAKVRQRHRGLGRGKLLLPELFLTQVGLAQAGI